MLIHGQHDTFEGIASVLPHYTTALVNNQWMGCYVWSPIGIWNDRLSDRFVFKGAEIVL